MWVNQFILFFVLFFSYFDFSFDAGDCGIELLHQLTTFDISSETQHLEFKELSVLLNFTNHFSQNFTIINTSFNNSQSIRYFFFFFFLDYYLSFYSLDLPTICKMKKNLF